MNIRIPLILILASFLFPNLGIAQSFQLPPGTSEEKIKVKIVSNIVIIPVVVNGTPLSFILDTGANGTIIFQIESDQKIEAKNATYIEMRGAGEGDPIKAIKSTGNNISVGSAISQSETMYVILDELSNFSPRLGFAVQGILGYQFFKDFIVEINYPREYIILHKPESYTYKKKKKNFDTQLLFHRNRPYIKTTITLDEGISSAQMLLDSGASDALWLFKNKKHISVPKRNFKDYLGIGLNGNINGSRAFTPNLQVGPFKFAQVTTAFPDSTSIQNLHVSEWRNGSVGADFLKRFHCIIDYPNRKLTLTKNRDYNAPFVYNKSGLIIKHGEYTLSKKLLSSNDQSISRANEYTAQIVNVFKSTNYYKTVLLPTYEIAEIRPNSPAADSGFQTGDLILRINNRNTEKMSLEEINNYFYQEGGKVVRIRIEREGIPFNLAFTLKDIL
tara:strand:+ start:1575 stop:2909 length:1335 start_codon:yes stop_codon:yes gene_type:complete